MVLRQRWCFAVALKNRANMHQLQKLGVHNSPEAAHIAVRQSKKPPLFQQVVHASSVLQTACYNEQLGV